MNDSITRLNAALSGRYRIERELGAGGMATVYLAYDLKHERKVALKVLKPELAAVVGAERFLAEIRTTANLQHPHILALYDSGEAEGLLFYVMPYVDGESLRARLGRERQLPVDDAVRIAMNVAEALDYAHRQGVIHRDIKPANILLVDGKPVIADFGIALAVSTGGEARLTETGLSLGTPHYMSPEQATGDQSVGTATDIWALGCVLYEMLVGEPPFTGSTPQAILGRIIAGDMPSARAERAPVPPNVDAVIVKALEKVPADRFTAARDVVFALQNPSFSWRVSGAQQTSWSRTRRTLAAGAVAVVSIVAVVGLGVIDPSSGGTSTIDGQPPADGTMVTQPDPTTTTVLVVPPANQTSDPSFNPLADRVADAIRRSLIQGSEAQVAQRVTSDEVGAQGAARFAELITGAGASHAIVGALLVGVDSLLLTLEVLDRDGRTLRVLEEVSAARGSEGDLTEAAADRAAAAVLDLIFQDGFEFRYWSLPKTAEAMRFYRRSMFAFNEERVVEAVELLLAAIEADPEWPRPYWILWQTSGLAGNRQEVWPLYEETFESLRPRLSTDEELYIVWQRGTPEEALEAAERRYELTGGAGTTALQLAWSALALNRLELAARVAEEQDMDHPEMRVWSRAWVTRGQVHHLTGQFAEELSVSEEARRRIPDEFWFLMYQARALLGLGQEGAALRVYSELSEVPTSARTGARTAQTRRLWNALHEGLFEFQMHGGNEVTEQALTIFRDWALQADLSRLQLAATYYRLERFEDAIPLFEAEFEASEGLARLEPGALLAISLHRVGRYDEADSVEAQLVHPEGSTNWRRVWPALAAAGRSDPDRAIEILARAFGEGVPTYPLGEDFMHFRPEFDVLRDDPRYQRLMRPR